MGTMLSYDAKGWPKETVELVGPGEMQALHPDFLARLTNEQFEVLLTINQAGTCWRCR